MKVELDDLVAPLTRERFRAELYERAEQLERRSARRWRVVAIGAIAVAVAAVSGAGVLAHVGQASVTIDRTIACPVPIQGGVPVFSLFAQARRTYLSGGTMQSDAAQLIVAVNANGVASRSDYAAVTSARGGFGMDSRICHSASKVPLERSGLPKYFDFLKNQAPLGGISGARCLSGSGITLRLRTQIAASGAPQAATLVVRSGKKLRPLAYVDWKPDKVSVYLSPACHVD
ncbi:MAG: hypothetical protein ABI990_06925 [Actinomycetota bacterium]